MVSPRPPQRLRPQSAAPLHSHLIRPSHPFKPKTNIALSKKTGIDEDDGMDNFILHDDEDCSDEEKFNMENNNLKQINANQIQGPNNLNRKSRPTSAPVGRKPQKQSYESTIVAENNHDRGVAQSIEYLRLAAEKKKAQDREFARELELSEIAFQKSVALKMEQLNRMNALLGSNQSYVTAADREGQHMIKVIDPSSQDRLISIDVFLREFEKNASVPLGQGKLIEKFSRRTSITSLGKRHSMRGSLALSDRPRRSSEQNAQSNKNSVKDTKRPLSVKRDKALDTSLVQEELKSVLENTIALTKALQVQLHELKLKGWNFASHSSNRNIGCNL